MVGFLEDEAFLESWENFRIALDCPLVTTLSGSLCDEKESATHNIVLGLESPWYQGASHVFKTTLGHSSMHSLLLLGLAMHEYSTSSSIPMTLSIST